MLLLDYIHQSFSHRPYTLHIVAPLGVMGNTRASMTLNLLVPRTTSRFGHPLIS